MYFLTIFLWPLCGALTHFKGEIVYNDDTVLYTVKTTLVLAVTAFHLWRRNKNQKCKLKKCVLTRYQWSSCTVRWSGSLSKGCRFKSCLSHQWSNNNNNALVRLWKRWLFHQWTDGQMHTLCCVNKYDDNRDRQLIKHTQTNQPILRPDS